MSFNVGDKVRSKVKIRREGVPKIFSQVNAGEEGTIIRKEKSDFTDASGKKSREDLFTVRFSRRRENFFLKKNLSRTKGF